MSECSHDCSNCAEACASRDRTSFLEKPKESTHIKKVIAVMSGKGGVGKSLVTSMLAVLSSRMGYQVGILDADVTGPSIPMAFGIHEAATGTEEGILPSVTRTGIRMMSVNLLLEDETSPVVWRGPIIAGTVKQFWTDVMWGDLDVLYIDMPPGTGDVPLTVFQSIPVDCAVVVATPQSLVGMIVEKAVNMAKMMNIPVAGLVENMAYILCPHCGQELTVFGEPVKEPSRGALPLLGRLPVNGKLSAACDRGLIELFDRDWLDGAVKKLLGDL